MTSSLRATKAAILDAALRHVPTHGWHESLNMGCREAGLSPAAKSCLFPRQHAPVFSLIQYFQLLADNHMIQHVSQATTSKSESPSAKAVEAVPFSKMRTAERVKFCAWSRIQFLIPYRHRWPEAVAVMASSPRHMQASFQQLQDTCDKIWTLAGDHSNDFSWYSKRLALMPVYAAAELYLVSDDSTSFVDTKDSLARNLELVSLAGYRAGQIITSLQLYKDLLLNYAKPK